MLLGSIRSPQPCTAEHRNQGSASDARTIPPRGQSRHPRARNNLEKPASLGFRRRRIFLAEFIDAAAGIHNFLLAGIERVAIGAHLDLQILAYGLASLELIAAGTVDCDQFVFGMNAGFHGNLDMSVAAESTSLQQRIATPQIPRPSSLR